MDLQLEGRKCLVTGANQGIGKGTARVMAAEGCRVANLARKCNGGEASSNTLCSDTPDSELRTRKIPCGGLKTLFFRILHSRAYHSAAGDFLQLSTGKCDSIKGVRYFCTLKP